MPRPSLLCVSLRLPVLSTSLSLLILSCSGAQIGPQMASRDSEGSTVSVTGKIHYVQVGVNATLKFIPNTLNANVGDSVVFIIYSVSHTVSQSRSYEEPCVGGGFRSPAGAIDFDILINDTMPIPVHCERFCGRGMVMIINPYESIDINIMSIKAQPIFTQRPLAIKVPPPPPPGPLLPLSTAGGNSVASTSHPSHTRSVTPGESQRAASFRRTAAAAGTAALALCAILAVGAWYVWRRRAKRARGTGAGSFRGYPGATSIPLRRYRKGGRTASPIAPGRNGDQTNAGDLRITPLVLQDALVPETTSLAVWKTKLLGPGGRADTPVAAGGRGDRDVDTAEELAVDVAFLLAELDRVRAENEMLRQSDDPPAYSDRSRSEP